MSGHSQFKNIMHRKGAQDKIRARTFSKLGREITVAAKSGLPDPAYNPRLRAAIAAARDIVDNYAQGGGVFSTIFSGDERLLWDAIEELHCYSREYYEKH